MKKHKLLFLGAALAATTFVASADTPFDPSVYAGKNLDQRVDKNGNPTNDRSFTRFTLNNVSGNSLDSVQFIVNQGTSNKDIYQDLSNAAPFVTTPGATVEFRHIAIKTNWMHGYLYIDWDGDDENFGFNSYLNKYPTVSGLPATFAALQAPEGTHGDLMSFTKYNFGTDANQTWRNSLGESPLNNDGRGQLAGTADKNGDKDGRMPNFTIPDYATPGKEYFALFKIDYNDLTQHSEHPDGKNDIAENGGCVVLFKIKIAELDTRTVTISAKGNGTVAFVGNDGPTFANENVTVEATAADGHLFGYWTKDQSDDIISTANPYTFNSNSFEEKEYTIVAHFFERDHLPFIPESLPTYVSNDSKNRGLNTLTLVDPVRMAIPQMKGDTKFEVNQPRTNGASMLVDLTGDENPKFTTHVGNTVEFGAITGNNFWALHGFLFIDFDQDGGFNSKLNSFGKDFNQLGDDWTNFNAALRPSEDGDLVSFMAHNIGRTEGGQTKDYYVNSLGAEPEDLGAGPNGQMPAFVIPNTVTPGTYRALFKVDWNDIDQHGNKDPNNKIEVNNGGFALFNIEILPAMPRGEWPTEGESTAWTHVAFKDAAYVTVNYQTTNIDPEQHTLKAYATHTCTDDAATSNASTLRAFALADEAEEGAESTGLIVANNFNQNDNTTLEFTLPSDATTATLLFAHNEEGLQSGKAHSYDVYFQAVDKSGNPVGPASAPQTISFETTEGGTSGVVDIEEAATVAPRYYNLQGIEVAQPTSAGVYIVRQGNAVSKVYVK